MENNRVYPLRKEYIPMAHRPETPREMAEVLVDAAIKVCGSEAKEERVDNIVLYMQHIHDFMNHFRIEESEVESIRDSKAAIRGGFKERKVQSMYGTRKMKLVRDRLSEMRLKNGSNGEYLELLDEKLVEETRELIEAMGKSERTEELGDVFEVINTQMEVRGIDTRLVENKRRKMEIDLRRNERERRKFNGR